MVSLRIGALSFKLKEKESLGAAWARFNDLVNSGPDLAIQDPILLQHFYMRLSGETAQFLDTTSRVAFLHCSASEGRKILDNTPYASVLDDSPEDVIEKTLEEEPVIVEPEPLATPLEASTVLQIPEPPKKEEILPLENMFEFEEDLFSDFGNTSNYHAIRKSSAPLAPNQHLSDPTEEKFLKKTVKELTTIVSNEWLRESKLSPKLIRLDYPSTSIHCQIRKTSFDAFYNPVIEVNLMSIFCTYPSWRYAINSNDKTLKKSLRANPS